MTTLFEKIFRVMPYKDIRTYANYSKLFLDYKPLFNHTNARIAKYNVKKINDQELLVHIANDGNTARGVADLALQRIIDKQVIINALRFWHTQNSTLKTKFEKKLDDLLIVEVASTSDPLHLAEIARTEGPNSGSNIVRFAAVDSINDLATLESIALDVNMRYTPVREHAADRITLLGGKRPEKLIHWTELIK